MKYFMFFLFKYSKVVLVMESPSLLHGKLLSRRWRERGLSLALPKPQGAQTHDF